MATQTFRARWVVPVDGEPIENGAIVASDGLISAVGSATELGAAAHDLGDVIVVPGFVNAHTHLELSNFRRESLASSSSSNESWAGSFWDWLDALMTRLAAESDLPQAMRDGLRRGAEQSMAAGVTCVGDISRTGINVQMLRASPIRKVCYVELISGARAKPNDLDSLQRMVEEATTTCDEQRQWVGVSPHAPYSVTTEDLAGCADWATQHALPITMHLLETEEENRWLGGGTSLRLVHGDEDPSGLERFLEMRRLPTFNSSSRQGAKWIIERVARLRNAALFAHVNYVDDREIKTLAKYAAHVVWCPRTHHFFGHAPHRWQDMLEEGISVCVGTDSLASNPDLSVLSELRHIYAKYPDVYVPLILEMGTIRGAVALGRIAELGSLVAGKFADFVTVPWDAEESPDPVENLLGSNQPVSGTWIGGVSVS